MSHQDIAKLMLLCMGMGSIALIVWFARPIWTVRFKGKTDSVQFRAYTSFGLRRAADAYRRKHALGSYMVKKGY